MGYPEYTRKRIKVDVTKLILQASGGESLYLEEPPNIELSVALVYENHVLEGNNDRVEFLWK